MWQQQLKKIHQGDIKTLARCISLVENEVEHIEDLLIKLPKNSVTPIIGITGPPGAGKSTLVDALIELIVAKNNKVAILCIDPSSPFNLGALLGDRIRMSQWYNNPNVYIRSLASRGSLGGLHPKIIEISDLIKAAHFDYIIVETVGVGQSEIEIVGLADITVVVVVPEAGDEVQTMKAGLMEIADIFVVNKADRPDATVFVKNLQLLATSAKNNNHISVVKTIATNKEGILELWNTIKKLLSTSINNNKKSWLLTQRLYYLIAQKRMQDINKVDLKNKIEAQGKNFNLYKFLNQY